MQYIKESIESTLRDIEVLEYNFKCEKALYEYNRKELKKKIKNSL